MEEYYAELLKLPLFHGFSLLQLPKLLERLRAQKRNYKAGSFVKREGDPADFIGIVLEGSVHVMRIDYDGNRNIISAIEKGELFAEAFVCAGVEKLPVDIAANTDAVILFLSREQLFAQTVQMEDGRLPNLLIANLLRIVAGKNVKLNQKLRYLSNKTTAEKLLDFLSDQAKEHHSKEFTIPYSRQELADFLGVERSAMSAEISKLQKKGILETKKNYFKLAPSLF